MRPDSGVATLSLSRERLSVADMMVLVASISIGFAGSATGLGHLVTISPGLPAADAAVRFALFVAPPAASLTVTILSLGLTGPSPRLRSIARDPGLLACGITTLAFVLSGTDYLLFDKLFNGGGQFINLKLDGVSRSRWLNDLELSMSFTSVVHSPLLRIFLGCPEPGFAVMIAWGTRYALGFDFRSEQGWRGRFGKLLGFYWVAMTLAARALRPIN